MTASSIPSLEVQGDPAASFKSVLPASGFVTFSQVTLEGPVVNDLPVVGLVYDQTERVGEYLVAINGVAVPTSRIAGTIVGYEPPDPGDVTVPVTVPRWFGYHRRWFRRWTFRRRKDRGDA